MNEFSEHEALYENDSEGNYTRYMSLAHAKTTLQNSGVSFPENEGDKIAGLMYSIDCDASTALFELGLD